VTGGRLQLGLRALALSLVGLLLVLLGVRVVASGDGRRLDEALAAGRAAAAPDFTLPRLDGTGSLRLASLRGKAVVVNFWASWCVPCKDEAPLLEAAAKRYRDGSVVVVGVDAQDLSGDARRFVRRYGVSYETVHDGPGATLAHYGVSGFPETWFVDRRGNVVGEHVKGPLTREQLLRDIEIARRS
jgi:cytochrome c biogenesis protein CcmG, thiol:disulfide interchange protein DsbE